MLHSKYLVNNLVRDEIFGSDKVLEAGDFVGVAGNVVREE